MSSTIVLAKAHSNCVEKACLGSEPQVDIKQSNGIASDYLNQIAEN